MPRWMPVLLLVSALVPASCDQNAGDGECRDTVRFVVMDADHVPLVDGAYDLEVTLGSQSDSFSCIVENDGSEAECPPASDGGSTLNPAQVLGAETYDGFMGELSVSEDDRGLLPESMRVRLVHDGTLLAEQQVELTWIGPRALGACGSSAFPDALLFSRDD